MEQWKVLAVLLLAGAATAACQRQVSENIAVPVTETLRDFELTGPVKKAVREKTRGWDERTLTFMPGPGEHTLIVLEFDRDGYLVSKGEAPDDGGGLRMLYTEEYVLDGRKLLREFVMRYPTAVALRVVYEYVTEGKTIAIQPALVEEKRKGLGYWTYAQTIGRGAPEVAVYYAVSGRRPELRSKRVLDRNRTGHVYTYGGGGQVILDEEHKDGRVVRRSDPSEAGRRPDAYTYEGAALWPSAEESYVKGQKRVWRYRYILDGRGNWTEKRTFEAAGEHERPVAIDRRTLEYYP